MTYLVGAPLNWAITAASGAGFLLFVLISSMLSKVRPKLTRVNSFGYDQGVMSGLLTGAAFTKTFPKIDTTSGGNGSASLQGTV